MRFWECAGGVEAPQGRRLGTRIADPMKRLLYVKAASAAMKATLGSVKSLMPTDFPSLGIPWLMSTAASLYGRAKVADRRQPTREICRKSDIGEPST